MNRFFLGIIILFFYNISHADECNGHYVDPITVHYPTTSVSFSKGGSFIDADEVHIGFKKAMYENFDVTELPLKTKLDWKGPNVPAKSRGRVKPFKEIYNKGYLESKLEKEGRTPAEMFAMMVFIIGSEQAYRHVLHSKVIQEGFAKLKSDFIAQSAAPTLESLKSLQVSFHQFSKSLKPVADPPTGILAMTDNWGARIDYEKMTIDVPETSFATGSNWDEVSGKPFKTDALVKNLKKEFEKLYTLKIKTEQDSFAWNVLPENFATFTTGGEPLMKGFVGSEVEYLIYKQLEAGMQQGLREMNRSVLTGASGDMVSMDAFIEMIEASLRNENPDISRINNQAQGVINIIQRFMNRQY